jgi:hypothetical protein
MYNKTEFCSSHTLKYLPTPALVVSKLMISVVRYLATGVARLRHTNVIWVWVPVLVRSEVLMVVKVSMCVA